MSNINVELIEMLDQAIRLEHAAAIQYRTHAEAVTGINAETIIERLQELAADEDKHAAKFRKLIGSFLGGIPTMEIGPTHSANDINKILEVNLHDEKSAIDFYKQIYHKIIENKDHLKYNFVTLEHDIRHIILDEEEHITELSLLLGK